MIDLDCPECGGETLHVEVEYETESLSYLANLVEKDCECELTDTQQETLMEEAIEKYTESDE